MKINKFFKDNWRTRKAGKYVVVVIHRSELLL